MPVAVDVTAQARMARARRRAATITIGRCADPARRARCATSPALFARTYFPETLYLPTSPVEVGVFAAFERCVRQGGRQSLAAPRGSGKTLYTWQSILWSLLYGHRRFWVYLCDSARLAARRVEIVKWQLEKNDLLAADFPAVCDPIRALEGRPQRAGGQLYRDTPTAIGWRADEIILPTVTGSKASGGRLYMAGLDCAVRGLIDPRGRPDAVVIDDPQSEESARSLAETSSRREIITKSLEHLGAQGSTLTEIMLGTIIERGDLVDEFSDPKRQPSWQGLRYQYLAALPDDEDGWAEYVKLRREGQANGDAHGRQAHAYYLANRARLDAGAAASLPYSYAGAHVIVPPAAATRNVLPDGSEVESSAVEHAHNVIADAGLESFLAEYQNAPRDRLDDPRVLRWEQVAAQLNHLPHRAAPPDAEHLTAMVDVHRDRLYLSVCAWSQAATGAVVHYQTYPANPQQTIASAYPGLAPDAALYQALSDAAGPLFRAAWTREDGATLQVDRLHVDEGWETDLVRRWVRACEWRAKCHAQRGLILRAGAKPFHDAARRPGERWGDHWRLNAPGAAGVRVVVADVGHWKSWVHARLSTPAGAPGSLTLWGDRADAHRTYAEHLTAERRHTAVIDGHEAGELWREIPGRPNHYLDTLVGCCVAASCLGVALPAAAAPPRPAPAAAPPRPAPAGGGWVKGGRAGGWIGRY